MAVVDVPDLDRSFSEEICYFFYLLGGNVRDDFELCPSITGGGAASPLWAGIKADVTGKTLKTLAEAETACLGSALAAAVGIGDFADLKTAADRVVATAKTYAPSGADYTAALARYTALDNKLF